MNSRLVLSVAILPLFPVAAHAQHPYQKPPPEILEVLHAPQTPAAFLSPSRDRALFARAVRYPDIADLAEPMLRLAGVRVHPRNNADASNRTYYVSLTLQTLPEGTPIVIDVPAGARLGGPLWNANGTRFAFSNETAGGIELWTGDATTARIRRVPTLKINPLLGSTVQWMPDHRTLLVKCIPAARGEPPAAPRVPPGPRILDSAGAATPSSTYEVRDVLQNAHDADLFEYYTTSQLTLVDTDTGAARPVGAPAVFAQVSRAPSGEHILVARIQRPYSYIRSYGRFAREVEVWSPDGTLVERLASKPVAEQVPIDGVESGPRYFGWRPTAPNTVVWAEALDGGDPRTKVPHRDRIVIKPIGEPARELYRTVHRYWGGTDWIDKSGLVLISDYDRDRHWTRTVLLDADDPAVAPRTVWDMSSDEKYAYPGDVVYRVLPNGALAVRHDQNHIFLRGSGSTPEGDRPFFDRLDLTTLATERLFRCDRSSLEYCVDWFEPVPRSLLTWHQSASDPPNLHLRVLAPEPRRNPAAGEAAWPSTARPLTRFPDPTPQIRGIRKQLVTYTRADGVPLSFTLCLPPGYKEGTRLPTVVWAYPLDYADAKVAGQVESTAGREFTSLRGSSELFFLLRGYAVLEDTAMPVIGPPETAYDTFIEQVVMNAKAAIDKAVELGVTDPARVGVGGHSHGALMTATLLAHSDLFRAGIARSGAYNHTLRPFGFQNERRTLFEARDNYVKLSPTLQADRFKHPLLLIHGELDVNPGTVALQSEKLYDAMRGVGKTVRLVMLPYESHGYAAKESIEHVLFEMLSWFDRHVKDAPPRATKTDQTASAAAPRRM